MPITPINIGPVRRLLIVMPTWVGDAVMAMPTLRALRMLYPDAVIAALCKPMIKPLVDACPWVDQVLTLTGVKTSLLDWRRSTLGLGVRLRNARFDAAVLLPNSIRAALIARMAGIPHRIGYDREARSLLLTQSIKPLRVDGRYVPVPTLEYYLDLARFLGSVDPDPSMRLFTRPVDDVAADAMLATAGFASDDKRPLVLINPGANFGDAKLWLPDRFAAVADRCVRDFGAVAAVTGAPKERPIIDAVLASAKEPIIDLQKLGLNLRILKSIVRRASLMVTNDTGPRHIAVAMRVPVVTVYGPTDPAWTVLPFADDRKVIVPLPCGPCQQKKCPLTGTPEERQCIKKVTSEMVYIQAADLLRGSRNEP